MSYLSVVKREWSRFSPRPLAWFVSFIFPLFLCILICLIFGKATPKNLPIAVWDADNSKLSRQIVRNLNALPSCRIKYQLTDMLDGENLIKEGKIYAFFVIPKNFQRDVYRLTQPKIAFYYNNQRILIGGIISKDVSLMIQSMLVGIDAKMKNKHGLPMDEAIRQSNLINVVDHIKSNPYFNYQYLLSLVAFGHILQISFIMISIWAVGTEFKLGTTKEWLKEADESILIAYLGKMTPYFLLSLILFLIIYFVYFIGYGVPFVGNIFVGFLATVLFITTSLFLSSIFMSINGNFRYCLSGAAFYSAMGFALAGVTYPVMSMPLLAKVYTAMLPLRYWIQIMLDQSLRNIPFIYDIKHFVPLLIMICISMIALIRLKHLALDEKRWYQS